MGAGKSLFKAWLWVEVGFVAYWLLKPKQNEEKLPVSAELAAEIERKAKEELATFLEEKAKENAPTQNP